MSFKNMHIPIKQGNANSNNKVSTTRREKPSFELLVRASQGFSYAQAIASVLVLQPEVEDKPLLLKTPCTSETGYRGP